MARVTGLTSTTANNLLLDAGAFFKNYDVSSDTPTSAAAKLIGATQGGGSFSAVPTVRQIEVDGGKTNVKGFEVIDGWTVTLTANVKEVTAASLELALGATTEASTTVGSEDYKKITGNDDFTDSSDYTTNITWVGNLRGSSKPVIIVVKNAMSLNGLSLSVADKAEAVIPVTVTGHYDPADLDSAPFEIYYPA